MLSHVDLDELAPAVGMLDDAVHGPPLAGRHGIDKPESSRTWGQTVTGSAVLGVFVKVGWI
jgi:hypothetical protein